MSVEALWSIHFWALPHKDSPLTPKDVTGQDAGVVALETGRVLGGDSAYIYAGEYEIKDKKITAKVRVQRYSPHLPQSVFGDLEDFNLTLTGEVSDMQMKLTGQSLQVPRQWLAAQLIRRAELP